MARKAAYACWKYPKAKAIIITAKATVNFVAKCRPSVPVLLVVSMSESFKWSSHVASHGLVSRGIIPLMGAESKTIEDMISFGVPWDHSALDSNRFRQRERDMGERFFPNEIPEFLPEDAGEEETVSTHKDSLTKLLSLPYRSFSKKLQRYALSLKDTIVFETWERSGKRVRDFNLYTGVRGTAYLLFKSCQVTRNKNDLKLCLEIVEACYTASKDSDRVTFIRGRAGVCALGAVAAKLTGDSQLQDRYLARFHEIRLPSDLPYELLYGRAGYLWACLFLNKHIEKDSVSSARMRSVVEEIFRAGRQLGGRVKCPLMFEWHGKKYWGTAHGLAGIMHVLMHVELEPDEMEDVKGTLSYMIQHRFPSGNYLSSEGSESDRLVYWCHGAPGVALTLVKAAQVFRKDEFVEAAMEAGEVVWNRGLLKRVGICHGISGNTYVFLSLYRLTGKPEYLYRAKAFASFLLDKSEKLISEGKMQGGDRPFSISLKV